MNEIETIDTTSPLYEIQLTHDECETFSEYLPDGFTLVEVAQTPAKSLSRSTRKSFHSDIHNSHSKTDHEPGTTPKASPERRVLRDHSKAKVRDQLGRRYSDYGSMPMTSSRPFKTTNEGMKKCYNLLQKVKKNKNSEPFRSRADGDEYGLADYYAMLPEPIDLSIVEERLRAEEYKSVNHFAADIRKIWNNSFRYMPKGSDAHLMTIEISSYFEELFKDIEDVTFSDTVKDLEKKVELLSQKITEMNTSGTKSNGSGGNGSMSASKSSSGRGRSMSLEDKKLLCRNIKKLPPEHLKGVWDIVGQGLKYTMDNREILEFDVHSLPMKVTRQLEKYVKQKMVEISKPANANGKGKGKGKGSNQKQEKQQKQKQQQPQAKNGKPAVFTQNINVMPVKLAKPDLNYHGLYDDVPLEQTIHEMEDYFAESSRGGIRREGETESKSGDSSFISDSDSESELGNKHKKRLVF